MAYPRAPSRRSYDVVIVGGAIMGSSLAWWLTRDAEFDGRILVVERDPTYATACTSLTNSCIRQQFATEINVRISQFGAHFVQNFRDYMGPEAPEIPIQSFGYLYLAGTEAQAGALRTAQALQASLGAATRLLTPDQIAEAYPFYDLDGVILGSHNPVDEGYFDGGTVFDWFRRQARDRGAEYIASEVVAIDRAGPRVTAVRLAGGESVAAGQIVDAAGTRAAQVARMAGLDVPVAPRRRYSFVFDAAEPLPCDLPLTIDPSGVHMRSDGRHYLCGCPPMGADRAMDHDDFAFEDGVWEEKLWPAIARRVPAFERVKVMNAWVGHYDYNTLDQNAIVGPHGEVGNFHFLCGFSGHGLQQSPAAGRGLAELLVHGEYRTLDLSPFAHDRIAAGRPFLETAII